MGTVTTFFLGAKSGDGEYGLFRQLTEQEKLRDLMILKGGASARRRLGDQALCQLRPNYEAALN